MEDSDHVSVTTGDPLNRFTSAGALPSFDLLAPEMLHINEYLSEFKPICEWNWPGAQLHCGTTTTPVQANFGLFPNIFFNL